MRKNIGVLIAAALVLACAAVSQTTKTQDHQVIFQLNSPGPDNWDHMLANMSNMQKGFAPEKVKIEVVCFAKGLDLLTKKGGAEFEARLKSAADSGIAFMACRNSMRHLNVKESDLFPFVGQVDSAVVELVRKQETGWAYIKAGE
jgi:intracellular sulfur oxidation DsrE/DsrF family protein